MKKAVAVFGATGAQGAPVVEEALAEGMRVRAVARDREKLVRRHPQAEAAVATLDDSGSVAAALEGVTAAFAHLPIPAGPDDAANWLTSLLEAASRTRLPLLVFTTGGPAGRRYPASPAIDAGTAAAEAVLASGVPAVVLQPALYLENLKQPVFLPRLRTEGILDYPPLRAEQRVAWTSHRDQARLAAAALTRPDLAGRSFDIGTPTALTGSELAELVSVWLGRPVAFQPLTPSEFGARAGTALGNPGVGGFLSALYEALRTMEKEALVVDTEAIQEIFRVKLTPVADHIRSWSERDAEG